MENTKAKNVIIVVLITLLCCCLGYMVWQYVTLNNLTNKLDVEEEQPEVKSEKLDIDSKLVKELHSYVPHQYTLLDEDKTAYQDKKITIKELNNELILANAFLAMGIDEEDKIALPDSDSLEWYAFKPDVLQANVKEMYGQTVTDENFYGAIWSCYFENGQYRYSTGGGGCCFSRDLTTIIDAYKKGDEIYIEDKYILFDCEELKENQDCEDVAVNLYSSSNKTNKIGSVTSKEQYNLEDVFKTYESKAQKYRHTYKLGENQTYYWYSSEPIMD